jgi:hypothetical protein
MVKEKEGGSKQGTHIIQHTIPRSKDRSGNRCWRRRRNNQQDRSCWTNKIASDAHVQHNACSKGKEVRVRIHGDRQMIVVEEEEGKRKIFLKSLLSGVNAPLNPLLQQVRRRHLELQLRLDAYSQYVCSVGAKSNSRSNTVLRIFKSFGI